jgi:hypothetical protein
MSLDLPRQKERQWAMLAPSSLVHLELRKRRKMLLRQLV